MIWVIRGSMSLSATSWVFSFYAIKTKWTFCRIPYWGMSLIVLFLPLVFSLVSILLFDLCARKPNERKETSVIDIRLADMEFLPVYLGYFFVSLSIPDWYTFWFVFAIILLFSFLSQTCYYNPLLMVFGYHFYFAEMEGRHDQDESEEKKNIITKAFFICKGRIIRNSIALKDVTYISINDFAYIVRKGK